MRFMAEGDAEGAGSTGAGTDAAREELLSERILAVN